MLHREICFGSLLFKYHVNWRAHDEHSEDTETLISRVGPSCEVRLVLIEGDPFRALQEQEAHRSLSNWLLTVWLIRHLGLRLQVSSFAEQQFAVAVEGSRVRRQFSFAAAESKGPLETQRL